ncbi:unnamed protein product [Linum trigynum]|uniref:Uncharacterized protein n=1 Tax=Linum trigynum TaxID=586398 RepID=A0AAV2GAB6_9ROSI
MRYRETTAMFNQLATKLSMADEKVYNRWMGALQKVCKEANKALSKTITSKDGNYVPTSGQRRVIQGSTASNFISQGMRKSVVERRLSMERD